jgi:hypothetical protein
MAISDAQVGAQSGEIKRVKKCGNQFASKSGEITLKV